MVPKGDFTKQKYIIGRVTAKGDEEENSTKTFNFKLPFDNFIGLENLMTNNPMLANSYLANKPEDGRKDDLTDTAFLNKLSSAQTGAAEKLAEIQTKIDNLQHNLSVIEEFYHQSSGRAIASIKSYIYPIPAGDGSQQTFFDALKSLSVNLAGTYDAAYTLRIFDAFVGFYDQYSLDVKIPESDLNELWTLVRATFDRQYNLLNNEYNLAVEEARENINNLFDTNVYSSANNNHLWSWTRGDTKPVIETKLGISIDFKTLLGNFRPLSGDYGLRILITGRTKPTEEKNSEEITEEVYLKKSDMYGNVYAFYEPYTQQKIFDISHLLTLNRIDIFFWQDHNFVDYTNKYIAYQVNDTDLPANIFVSNLDVKLGLTVDECNTDRVFLYTYDDMYYGYDPLDPNATESDLDNTRTLQFAWVHIGPDGPVLVNHTDYYPEGNTNDTSSLQYWRENGGAQIQWYHFEYGCQQDTTILAERQGGANWKYLSDYNGAIVTLVDDQGDDDPENDEYLTTYKDSFSIVVEPNILKAKDRWKAVVSVGNVPYSTDPLIFTNIDTNVETEAFDTLNKVVFRILHEEFNDSANIYNIVEDSTLRDFYFYDINDTAIRNENNRLYSDIDYYLQIWIRNNETGEYSPMTYDPDEGLVDVVFNWPQNNTMIRDWSDVYDEDLAKAELAPILNGASAAYNDRIKAITRKFHIKQTWKASLNNNTVSATVVRRNKTYHPTIQFNFGNVSSMGSDHTITVSQLMPAGSMIVKNQPFAIEATVRQKDGSHDPNSKYVFIWELLSPTVITQSGGEAWVENQSPAWQVDNTNGYIGNVIRGYVRNDYPPIFKVTVRNAADWDISQTSGFRLVSHADVADKYIVNSCAERVEFKADGTVPISYYGTFSVEMLQNAERSDYWPTWTMHQMRKANQVWTVLDEPDYFSLKDSPAGVKSVVTNLNLGIYAPGSTTEPGLDGPFSLTATSESPTYFMYNDLYEAIIEDYNNTIASAVNATSNIAQIIADAEYTKTTRLNNLNLAANKALPSYTVYSFDPYVKNSTQAPTWLWDDKLQNYYTYLEFTTAEGYFRQAVPFTRNLYSSTLLNSWDGKLHIDDENNAVLSQMVSAGTTQNGLFTGVVMGNWASVSDASLDIPGLYGLKDGGQVFGLKTDGTGFIGKAGRGRITFDGNQSLISNIDRTSYINLDPIRYHFDDNNNIIFDDYYGYSSYFLYSEANKTSTASVTGEDSLEQSTYWAKQYMDDTSKDYFIVDPNNGILTTGGVIARYGKIGNWLISESGLYQKYTDSNTASTQNRYMYLGYPGIDVNEVTAIENKYQPVLEAIEYSRQAAITDLKAQYQMEEFNVVGEYYANIFRYDPLHYYNYGWPYLPYINTLTQILLETNDRTSEDIIRYKFITLFKKNVEEEQRCGWHWHYLNGEKTGTPQYTGDRQSFYTMVTPLFIHEPSAELTSETCKNWADNGRYPDGTNRTVNYTEVIDSLAPVAKVHIGDATTNNGESVEIEGSNIPNGIYESDYWYLASEDTYVKIYFTYNDPYVVVGDLNGYASQALAYSVYETLEDEVKLNTVIAVKDIPGPPFYLIYNGIFYTLPDGISGEGGEGGTPGASPTPSEILESKIPYIPQYTTTYYTTQYPENDAYKWTTYRTEHGLLTDYVRTFDLNAQIAAPSMDTDEGRYHIWTREHIQQVLRFAAVIHSYYAEAYDQQLQESLAAGLAQLTATQLSDYYARKQQLEAELAAALLELNKKFDQLQYPIKSLMSNEIKAIYDNDKDRYAIYAGYNAPTILDDPLFSVNWRGYMTARAGRIGKNNPWYISDNGLTQTISYELTAKKYYGTIFLGNPEAGSNPNTWSDDAITDLSNITLLPNDGDNSNGMQGPTVLGYSDADGEPTSGKFAIYAGGNGYIREYDSTLHKFVRSWTNDRTIKFGVRLDGTLYSTWGQIGNWSITDSTLSNINDSIVLDSNGSQIVLGYGRTVIRGDGSISLGNYAAGEDGNTVVTGLIELAGYQLIASTANGPASLLNDVVNETNSNSEAATQSLEFSVNWHYNGVGTQTYSWSATANKKGKTTTQNANLVNANTFQIIESDVKLGNQTTGLSLVTGYLDGSNKTKTGTILYASGTSNKYATLGTETAPWNLFAGSVIGTAAKFESLYLNQDALWLGGERAATQPWVLEKLKELADLIPEVSGSGSSTGASSGLGRARSGANHLWAQLAEAISTRNYANAYIFASGKESTGQLTLARMYTHFTWGASEDGGNDASVTGVTSETETEIGGLGASVTVSQFAALATSSNMPGVSQIGIQDSIAVCINKLASATGYIIKDGSASADTAGTVTITLNRYSGSNPVTITFNQADTAFYKAHAIKQFYMGNGSTTTGSPGFSEKEYNPSIGNASITWAADGKSGTFTYKAVALDNTNVISGTTTIDTSSVYEQAWKAGWNAACANLSCTLEHPSNNTSGDVKAIAAIANASSPYEVTGKTITKTSKLTISASTGDDSHSAKLTYDTTMKIVDGASFTDGGGNSHNPKGTATWYKNADAELTGDGASASASASWGSTTTS